MSDFFTKCMVAPLVFDRECTDVLILTLLSAIAEEIGIDEDEILRKAQEVIDNL